MHYLTSLLLLFSFAYSISAQPLLRFPALSPDGEHLSFSYQGDIWVAALDDGSARRLTIHESYESHPQWSPNGEHIVFQGNRFGANDLFVTDPSGIQPRRLTHFSGSDGSASWSADGEILFNTRRFYQQVEREPEIYAISSEGGTPHRKLDALGFEPVASPDGRYIAMERGNCRYVREAYRGPANRNIWIYDTQSEAYSQVTTDEGQDILPAWGEDNTLYYLSARSGRYNLYSVAVENGSAGEPKRLTNYKDEGIRYFDVNAGTLVFEKDTHFYTMSAEGGRAQRLDIKVTQDYRFDPKEYETYTSNVQEYSVSPSGKYMAMVVHGEIFLMPEDKDKSRAVPVAGHPYREQDIAWLNDSTLLFISDRDGNRDIFLARAAGDQDANLYKTFKQEVLPLTRTLAEESDLVLSPDHKKIAFQRGRGQLIVADIDSTGTLSNEITLLDGWDGPGGVSWSPDSKWLAYHLADLNFNDEIFIHAADNSQVPVNVSMHPRGDYNPVWSPDGSKLAFLSRRNGARGTNARADDTDIWFVWLKESDWEKTQRDWEEEEEESNKKKDKGEMVVEIDFEDIHDRLQMVTRSLGNKGNVLVSKDGETFYYTMSANERALMQIQWDGSEEKEIVGGRYLGSLSWDKDHKQMYYLERGRPGKLNPSSKKPVRLPFEAKMTIDHEAEMAQVFDDGWRALNAGFYDPEFHGEDFEVLREKYRPRALAASTTQDFRDMFNEMLGQLNASHMGMYGSDPEETQNERTGLLGIEVVPDPRGVKITRVVPRSPASRESSQLRVGEIITAVNTGALETDENFYSRFRETANERVLLQVIGTEGEAREVIIRPTNSLRTELYEEWVAERQRLTEEYSNGELGYIHIRGMNIPSYERFERELTASGYGKKGVVIDVRFNGGGSTTDMLMTVLNVRQHAYTIPRGAAASLDRENQKFANNYPFSERLPMPPLMKPSIALCNENSYSNAEIFSHAYKTLDIGTLVGQPTFGAVISTGSYRLMNGYRVRMPFRAWYVKATGENMEHGPAVPDIIVENAPDGKAKGQDLQLKKSVETLLEQLNDR
ncbi:MAG TPA: S41 family peptidase [Saprospiraceae bacterium]|nr:S41 family peptidase [Saprospiraceae bacterium]